MKAAVLILFTTGCALSNHPTLPARTPQTSIAAISEMVRPSGPIRLESVVSARWAVPLGGLLDLEDPKAVAAGLEDEDKAIVLPVHVLVHPEHGVAVVDTGVSTDRMEGGRGAARGGVEYFLREVEPVEPLAEILARQPAELWGVLLTHAHVDHVLGIADLPAEAPIYVGPGELAATSGLHMFLRSTYDALLEGRAPVRELAYEARVGPFEGVIDLFGDGSLWAIWAPGHTPGSTAYLANTTDGPVLFVGDTSHTQWGWDHGVTPGSYTADHAKNKESLDALRALVDVHPEIRVFVGHEMPG